MSGRMSMAGSEICTRCLRVGQSVVLAVGTRGLTYVGHSHPDQSRSVRIGSSHGPHREGFNDRIGGHAFDAFALPFPEGGAHVLMHCWFVGGIDPIRSAEALAEGAHYRLGQLVGNAQQIVGGGTLLRACSKKRTGLGSVFKKWEC
jgi:hypothetical protein